MLLARKRVRGFGRLAKRQQRHGELIGAYEFKSAPEVGGDDFSGLRAFRSEYPDVPLSVVYRGQRAYRTDDIHVIPWRQFVQLEH